jgi:hypothetical protein
MQIFSLYPNLKANLMEWRVDTSSGARNKHHSHNSIHASSSILRWDERVHRNRLETTVRMDKLWVRGGKAGHVKRGLELEHLHTGRRATARGSQPRCTADESLTSARGATEQKPPRAVSLASLSISCRPHPKAAPRYVYLWDPRDVVDRGSHR